MSARATRGAPQRVGWRDVLRGTREILAESAVLPGAALGLAMLRPDSRASLGGVLAAQARRLPDQVALRFDSRSWSYAEFNDWVNRCAHVLADHGAAPGHKVALLMQNRPEVLAYAAAAAKLGAVSVLLNPNQRAGALAQTLARARPLLLVLGEECAGALVGLDGGWIVLLEARRAPRGALDARRLVAAAPAAEPAALARVRARDALFHIYTSGTTGQPKASVMTHLRWLRCMHAMGRMALRLRRDDVFYCALPLYHNNALTVSWSAALGSGCTFALGRRFSASRFWDEVRAHDASAFCYIGELGRYLLQQPPSPRDRDHRVRLMVGNGLRAELWGRFRERFGVQRIVEFYGASEGNLGFANVFGIDGSAGFCPFTYAIVEVDVEREAPRRGPRGRLRRVGAGGTGLLITKVSARAPFDGYAEREANASRLLHDVFRRGDTWFNSGDLVRDQGLRHIEFVDRLGDSFRWKGENVATGEVEAALAGCPGVVHAIAYGVQVPGCEGRAGMAAVVLRGAFHGRALARRLRAALPGYAVPVFLRVLPRVETTSTLKYRRVAFKAQGFGSDAPAGALYVLLDPARGYEPLTPALAARLQRGDARL